MTLDLPFQDEIPPLNNSNISLEVRIETVSSTNPKSPAQALNGLAIGLDDAAMRMLREALPSVVFRQVPMDISKLLKADGEQDPDIIFCGQTQDDVDLVELATGVRSVYSNPPLYYVSTQREGFDQHALAKNGFADAFLLPMDKGIIRGLLPDGSSEYKDVPLIDIAPDTVLDFDTYVLLPLNRKYIRFSSSGYTLAGPRAKRLMDHEVRKVYISVDQVAAYVRFTAGQLKNISTSEATTPEEKRALMYKAVRSLLSGFLSENAEVADYNEIVKSYILATGPENSVYERMLAFSAGGGDAYSHVSNVSALACLFSLGLNIGKAEEIALAGLLHDIGLADVPLEIQEKAPEDRDEGEQAAYQQHPMLALQIIRDRQIELNTRVLRIIEQHHERWDARGYPSELRGEAIMPESQLLAIADEFEYATQIRPGKTRVTAREALDNILKSPAYDPDLLQKIAELLNPVQAPEQKAG